MFALLRAPQDAVIAALRPGGIGIIGPASPLGWLPAWVPDDARLDGLGDRLLVIEDEDMTYVRLAGDGGFGDWRVWHVAGPDVGPTARDIATHLGVQQRQGDVETILNDADNPDDLAQGLSALVGVGNPDGPAPTRAVVVHRGKPLEALLGARLTAHSEGPVRLAQLDDRWTVALSADVGDSIALAEAVAGMSPKRRSRVVLLWRDESGGSGLTLWGTNVRAAGEWDSGWVDLEEDWAERDAETEALRERFDVRPEHVPALRALMRARTRQLDPLAEAVSLLGLPPEALEILDGRTEPDVVAPANFRQFMGAAWRDTHSEPHIGPRWAQVALGSVALVLALLSLLLAVTMMAVIATNGSFTGQGVEASDWILAIAACILAPLNAAIGTCLLRFGTFY